MRRYLFLTLWILGAVAAAWWYLRGIGLMWGSNPLFTDEGTYYDQKFYIKRAAEDATAGAPQFVARSRMPLYPWLLSWLYDSSLSDKAQIDRYIRFNVCLGIAGLAVIFFASRRRLGNLLATILTLVAAFTFFLFKNVLIQPEISYYSLYFLLFVLMLEALRNPGWKIAGIIGLLGGMVHMLKGSAFATLVLFGCCLGFQAIQRWWRSRKSPAMAFSFRQAMTPAAMFALGFLIVTGPFLWETLRAYGSPFYDPNTKYYMWVDSPSEMRALQDLELATRKPELNVENWKSPLVQRFLPKWLPDEKRRGELAEKVAREKVVVLQGEWEILPTSGSWLRRHGFAGFRQRIWQGLAGRPLPTERDMEADPTLVKEDFVTYEGLFRHNFRHPNGYIWHLYIFAGGAAVGLLLMLVTRIRNLSSAFRSRRMAIFFATTSFAGNFVIMGFWTYISDHNRFFLGQFLPLLYVLGWIARWSLNQFPWPNLAKTKEPIPCHVMKLPAPCLLIMAWVSARELKGNFAAVPKLQNPAVARKQLHQ